MGNAFFRKIKKECPQPISSIFWPASSTKSSLFPAVLTRQSPEASANANPNLAHGTVLNIAS